MSNENVKWEEAYSLGHEKIDQEHQNLFKIAQKLNNCEDSDVFEIVKELVKYTRLHFKNEENFMASISYEKLDEHKELHVDLINKINSIIEATKNNENKQILLKANDFVYKELLPHILLEDKRVHHALKNRDELKKGFMWRASFALGNELIDNEHQELFRIALKALDYHGVEIKDHIKLTISELYDYMKYHFEHEQEYMASINYPLLEDHIKLHDVIINQINDFIKTLPSIQIEEFERKLIENMDIWLINHILYEDRKIINFLENK